MRIITWNINRCNGTWDRRDNGDIADDRKSYAKRIVEKIAEHIEKEDDIAILQEFPIDDDIIKESLPKKLSLHSWYLGEGATEEEKKRERICQDAKEARIL